jgi:tetratricopeptide (TPR) repeat protein
MKQVDSQCRREGRSFILFDGAAPGVAGTLLVLSTFFAAPVCGQVASASTVTPTKAPAEQATDLDPQAIARLEVFEKALTATPDDLRLGNDYRKEVIAAVAYDRALAFFEQLTTAHPRAASAWLNYGYVYVDKITVAGAITQVILANAAIQQFSKSIEVDRTWIGLYTRGNSYLFWPKIFGRAPLGVTDLEEAVALARLEASRSQWRPVLARCWTALGDGYFKTDQLEKARNIWREGLTHFPNDIGLLERLARLEAPVDGQSLEDYLAIKLDPHARVDTNLDILWQ